MKTKRVLTNSENDSYLQSKSIELELTNYLEMTTPTL